MSYYASKTTRPMSRRTPRLSLPLALLLAACAPTPDSLPPAAALPEPQSAGALLLQSHCAYCHGAPPPATHRAETWPGVVYRMQTNLVTKAYAPLTEAELETLIGYLQRNAGSVDSE